MSFQNLPFALNNPAIADASVEGASSGMNAGSCAPGIGISQLSQPVVGDEFTLSATGPQKSSNLGWGGLDGATGQLEANLPSLTEADYLTPGFAATTGLNVTTGSTAADAEIGTSGYFNRTGVTVGTGVWLWGTTDA
jgi:hypothetical protein